MLHMMYCDGDNATCELHDTNALRSVLDSKTATIWLDAQDPTDEDWNELSHVFSFHPLAVEDARQKNERAKVDTYDGYLFVSVQAWTGGTPEALVTADLEDVTEEIDIFLGANYIVTIHNGLCGTIAELRKRWQKNPNRVPGNESESAYILYMLLDTIVDGYFPAMDALDIAIDDVETSIYAETHALTLDTRPAIALRKKLMLLRQTVTPMRDLLNTLLRNDEQLIPDPMRLYYQDVYDHALRLVEQVDLHRDILSGVLESMLAQSGNRLNQVVKTMTAISTILMTNALIAGIYGMNFKFMPELEMRNGYYWCLAGMATLTVAMVTFFKRIGWF